MFELSLSEWVVSDLILGTVLYLSYLVMATVGSTKTHYSFKKSPV